MSDSKRLQGEFPAGTWFYIGRLPLTTTAEQLSDYFHNIGLDIPPTHISVKTGHTFSSAVVSLERENVLALFSWCINGQKFQGHAVEPRAFERKKT